MGYNIKHRKVELNDKEMQVLRDIMKEEIEVALEPVVERLDGVEENTRHTRMIVQQQITKSALL